MNKSKQRKIQCDTNLHLSRNVDLEITKDEKKKKKKKKNAIPRDAISNNVLTDRVVNLLQSDQTKEAQYVLC